VAQGERKVAQDFLTTLDERSDGIGAADKFRIVTTLTAHGDTYSIDPETGWLHTYARRLARWERMRAFDRIPAYAALEPAGNHTFGATKAELRLGCPAFPR
jgi:hypothetical protein